jgi:hypothetical protein
MRQLVPIAHGHFLRAYVSIQVQSRQGKVTFLFVLIDKETGLERGRRLLEVALGKLGRAGAKI